MNVVDLEIRTRINTGFKKKFGEDMSDDELTRFYRLAGLAKMNPLVNTFAEIDLGIQTISKKWKPKARYAKT